MGPGRGRAAARRLLAISGLTAAAACAAPETEAPQGPPPPPDYRGVETTAIADDLVQLRVAMGPAATADQLTGYADCAAAGYTLVRGFGFARHLRTNVDERGGVRIADAVYTISPTQPRGLRTIDAEKAVAVCTENGIPTL